MIALALLLALQDSSRLSLRDVAARARDNTSLRKRSGKVTAAMETPLPLDAAFATSAPTPPDKRAMSR